MPVSDFVDHRNRRATPECILWQAVVFRACIDALNPNAISGEPKRMKLDADRWLRDGSRDFWTVCSLSGIDGSFIRSAYVNGLLDHATISVMHNNVAGQLRNFGLPSLEGVA